MIPISNNIIAGQTNAVFSSYALDQFNASTRAITAGATSDPSLCLDDRIYDLRNRIQEIPQTNFISNNTMVGASGGPLPNTWEAQNAPSLSQTITISGTASGFQTVGVVLSGTADTDNEVYVQFGTSGIVSTYQGDLFVGSAYFQLSSGSVSGITNIGLEIAIIDSTNPGIVLESFKTTFSDLSSGFVRFSVSGKVSVQGSTDDSLVATMRFSHNVLGGSSYDYRVIIGVPQLERGLEASPVITTSTGSVTRITGRPSVLVVPQLTRQSGTNLLLYSEEFNVSGTWTRNLGGTGLLPVVTANSVISPDGGQTADTVVFDRGAGNTTNDRSLLEQSVTIPTTGTYIFSVYAKASAAGDVGKQIFIRLGGAGGLIAITLTANWVRYSTAETSVASGSQIVQIGNRGTFTAGNSVSVDLWGAQLEVGSTATPYIPTTTSSVSRNGTVFPQLPTVSGADFTFTRATTATRVNASGLIESVASGVPRIDWLGQSCPALLVEASGQNLAFQSQAFDVSGNWTQSNVTVTPNVTATLDPAGGNTADLLADSVTTGSTSHRIYTTPVPASAGSISVVSGTTYSTSLFVKAGTSSVLRIVLRRDNEAVIGIGDTIFNVTSGTITSGSGTIENYGNGWYRCTNIGTSNFTGGARIFINLYDTAGNQSYIGTAGTNNMYIWGAQLETGAIPTSYIPTTTASATRNADVCSVSGVSAYIGQTQGTLYAEFEMRTDTSTRRILTLSDGSQANRIMLVYSSNALRAQIQGTAISLGNPADGFHKVAFAYEQNGASGTLTAILDGGAVVSGTSATYPTSLNTINLGKIEDTTTTSQINSRIRAAAIYTTRLSNDQLANITRLT